MLKSRTVQIEGCQVTLTQEKANYARQSAAGARSRGDEWVAQNAERYATMIDHVLTGGEPYDSYVPSGSDVPRGSYYG